MIMTTPPRMAYEGMLAETVTYAGAGGDRIDAYMARPLGPGPFPGVIVIPEVFGLVTHIKEVTRRIAARGYTAIAPELYTRVGPPDPTDMASVGPKMMALADAQAIGDLESAITFLKNLPQSNGKVGVIGFCSGGRHTLLLACQSTQVDAAVDCWGGRTVEGEVSEARPVLPIDLIPNLSCPLLGIFGEEDTNPTPEHVERLRQRLTEHKKEFEFKVYPNAGHAFFADYRPSYRQEAAVDAWVRVFDFFEKHLATAAT